MSGQIYNFVAKIDVDTWCILGTHTNPEITEDMIFESEQEAVGFLQAQNLPYTTGTANMRGNMVIVTNMVYHCNKSYTRNAFMEEFAELF